MKKCNVNELKGGEYYSRLSFGKILSSNGRSITIQNEDGKSWTIDEDIVSLEFDIHGQYTSEEKVTRTEMVNILKVSTRIVFIVNYNKQAKPADVIAEISELYPNKGGDLKSEKAFNKAVKERIDAFIKGDERTLIGWHQGREDDFGRLRVIDLQEPKELTDNGYDKRFRLVDPRTLNWLIVNNIKYTIK